MMGFFGSYLGPTRGGNPMLGPQPLSNAAILAAGFGDLAMAMQGQPGQNLAQLRYTQQLAVHNEAERERLRRKEEREEEELRLRREDAERRLATQRRLDAMVAGHFGGGVDTYQPSGGTASAPVTPPTTAEGDLDWGAIRANPDQWEIYEVDGQTVVEPRSGAAPPPPGMAAGVGGTSPQQLRSLGDLFFRMNQPEQATKYYAEARAQEDQVMDWAANRRAEAAHARAMAQPTGGKITYKTQFVSVPGRGEVFMRTPSDGGPPEYYDTELGQFRQVNMPIETPTQRVRQGELSTSVKTALQKEAIAGETALAELQTLSELMERGRNFAGLPANIQEGLTSIAGWADQTFGTARAGKFRNKVSETIRSRARVLEGMLLPVLTGDERFTEGDVSRAREALQLLNSMTSDEQAKAALGEIIDIFQTRLKSRRNILQEDAPAEREDPVLQVGTPLGDGTFQLPDGTIVRRKQ